jgi:hypothetical protein
MPESVPKLRLRASKRGSSQSGSTEGLKSAQHDQLRKSRKIVLRKGKQRSRDPGLSSRSRERITGAAIEQGQADGATRALSKLSYRRKGKVGDRHELS